MAESSVRGDLRDATTDVEIGAIFHQAAFRNEIDGMYGRSWLPLFERALVPSDHHRYVPARAFVDVAQPIELNWKRTLNEGSDPSSRLNRPNAPEDGATSVQ